MITQNIYDFVKFVNLLLTKDTPKDGFKTFCYQPLREKGENGSKTATKPYKFVDFTNKTSKNTLEFLFKNLCNINNTGCMISIALNEFNFIKNKANGSIIAKRTSDNVSRVRCFAADIDAFLPIEVINHIAEETFATITNLTSKHPTENTYKAHLYWLTDSLDNIGDYLNKTFIRKYNEIQLTIAQSIDTIIGVPCTDKQIHISMQLRSPGFLHQKTENLFTIKLHTFNLNNIITAKTFDKWLSHIQSLPKFNYTALNLPESTLPKETKQTIQQILNTQHLIQQNKEAKQKDNDSHFDLISDITEVIEENDVEEIAEPDETNPNEPTVKLKEYCYQHEGTRHSTMVKLATDLLCKLGYEVKEMHTICVSVNATYTPPLDVDELNRICTDAVKYFVKTHTTGARPVNIEKESMKIKEVPSKITKNPNIINEPFKYDYSDIYQFIDVLSDKSIMYRLYQRYGAFVKGSKFLETRVYNPKNGTFEEDNGIVDHLLNRIICDMPKEKKVRDEFKQTQKEESTSQLESVNEEDEQPRRKNKKPEDTKSENTKSEASENDTVEEAIAKTNYAKLQKYIITLRSAGRMASLVKMVSSMQEFHCSVDDYDSNPNILNCSNCVIDLNTGKLLPHSDKYLCTHNTNVHVGEGDWLRHQHMEDTENWLIGEKGTLWTQFIYDIMGGNIDMCISLFSICGYMLGGGLEQQCLFFCYGSGRNGKSTFLETLLETMGTYGAPVTNTIFSVNDKKSDNAYLSEIAQLRGKRYVFADEINEGQSLHESNVKNITTGTEIMGKFLYYNPFKFKPQFTSFLHGNHKPTINGTDEGIWRRIVMLPFLIDFAGRDDRNLKAKLLTPESKREILAFCTAGRMFYNAKGLYIPNISTEAKSEYKTEMSALGDFLGIAIEKTENKDLFIRGKDLYNIYLRYCAYEEVEASYTQVRLANVLKKYNIKKHRTSEGIFYKVKLTEKFRDYLGQTGGLQAMSNVVAYRR